MSLLAYPRPAGPELDAIIDQHPPRGPDPGTVVKQVTPQRLDNLLPA